MLINENRKPPIQFVEKLCLYQWGERRHAVLSRNLTIIFFESSFWDINFPNDPSSWRKQKKFVLASPIQNSTSKLEKNLPLHFEDPALSRFHADGVVGSGELSDHRLHSLPHSVLPEVGCVVHHDLQQTDDHCEKWFVKYKRLKIASKILRTKSTNLQSCPVFPKVLLEQMVVRNGVGILHQQIDWLKSFLKIEVSKGETQIAVSPWFVCSRSRHHRGRWPSKS